MYYPKSQIKENLYTKGGEYFITSTQENYKGYYYQISNDKFFTGKNPQTGNNIPLTPYNKSLTQTLTNSNLNFKKTNYSVITDLSYLKSKNIDNFAVVNTLPTYFYPKVTEQDYKIGEFERYFLSKINETKFIETNKLTYNRYLNQDPNVAFQLYIPIKLSWVLIGKKEEVYKVNIRTVERTQFNLGLRGFVQYFKGRFTQFYK